MTQSKKMTLKVIPYLLVLIGFAIAWMMIRGVGSNTNRNHITGLQNNTYLRAMVCYGQHTSKPVGEREPNYVEKCNKLAEEATGQKIDRYGAVK